MIPTVSQLNKIKKDELLIIDAIHALCVKNKIRYSLCFGTLIGAIRHKGFIPWDDDIDIIISCDDFISFKKACLENLPSTMFFQDNEIEPGSCFPGTCKVRLNDTLLLEKANVGKKMHNGVWVDVFIVERFNGDTKIQKSCFRAFQTYLRRRDLFPLKSKNSKGKLYSLLFLFFHPFSTQFYLARFLKKRNRLEKDGKYALLPDCDPKLDGFEFFKCFDIEPIQFETKKYYITKYYDEFLTKIYGDYMLLPDEKSRHSTHSYEEIIV